MKIAIISGGLKSHVSRLSYKHILEDLRYIYNLNSKHAYIKHIDIGDNVSIEKEGFNLFGVPSKKEIVLPFVDIVIDTTHHFHIDSHSYSSRLKIPCLFKKNINRIDLKSILQQIELKVNSHISIKNNQDLDFYNFIRSVHVPSVIKSSNNLVPTFIGHTHKEIFEYILDNKNKDDIFVENYIRGKVYTCVFIKDFRGQDIYNSFIFEHLKKTENNLLYTQVYYLSEEIKSQIREIGQKIMLATDTNICELNFMITKNQNTHNIIINNCIFSPRYFPGSPFFEILKAHSINMLELAESFRDKK
jgi:hypothetical protein